MKRLLIVTAYTFLLSLFCSINGQDNTQPESPVLEFVSVNPVNGVAVVTWSPSPSNDVTRYVVYTFENSTAFAIDTVNDPATVTYTDLSSQARFKSITYVVAAMDAAKNISPLSNSLSTVFVTSQTDTCNNMINIGWNACLNERHPVKGYAIICSAGTSAPVVIDTVTEVMTSYSLKGYIPDTRYCFYINAFNDAGTVTLSSRSCTDTGIQRPPAWTAIEAVRITSGIIELTASYDSEGEISSFIAEKKHAGGSWQQTGSGSGTGGTVTINDDNPDTTTVSLYRISAVNNCGTSISSSVPARNIVLESERDGTSVHLRWNNPYPAEPAVFRLLRDTGNGYEYVITVFTDTTFIDDYKSYAFSVKGESIVYKIAATKYGEVSETGQSWSSASILETAGGIMTGNSFTPDGDGQNDTFAPVLSFFPSHYEFTIYDRLGVVLFRTQNPGEGWDGFYKGRLQPVGTYLWTLVLKTPSGASEKRNGTVAILP